MRDIDLNLLTAFDAIMSEQSISRAAMRMNMTQPAVSNALGRMRVTYNDPLFVKAGRGVKPTPKAEQLWRDVHGPLQVLRDAVHPPVFQPARAKRRFRLGTSDLMTMVLWPGLRRLIEKEAPGIDILAVPYTCQDMDRLLADGGADMVFGVFEELNTEYRSQPLFTDDLICAMRKSHPLAGAPLTMKRYLAADHLLVSLSGDPVGSVDKLLEQQGLKRRVAMTVNQFLGVPTLLAESNLICVAPRIAVTKCTQNDLHLTRPPFDIPTSVVSMAWHARCDRDPGHIWLRQSIAAICAEKSPRALRCASVADRRSGRKEKVELDRNVFA
ncbi:MAG: LysR family transcriptional regulator [Burkholderiales bacterium]|nr:LysR family transcriptional regulator [Burkholderiales bacterium]